MLRVLFLVFSASLVQSSLVQPHVESAECNLHLDLYKNGLTAKENWAQRMYDASTKLPEGVLEGIWVYFGNFDECLGVDAPVLEGQKDPQFVGKYCRVSLTNITMPLPSPTWDGDTDVNLRHLLGLPLRHAILNSIKQSQDPKLTNGDLMSIMRTVQISVCAPSSCGMEGVAEVASYNLGLVLGGATVTAVTVPESCTFRDDPERVLDAADWGFISLMIILTLLILASTVYDFYISEKEIPAKHELLTAFSFRSNCIQLFTCIPESAQPGTIGCIHGLRVLSIAFVVLGHRYFAQIFFPIINPASTYQNVPTKWINYTILNAYVDVDTLFLLSGLLVSYNICKTSFASGNKFGLANLPQYYIYRYIRLTAPLALQAFFVATLAEFVSNGPLWSYYVKPVAENCQTNWWTTLLYVNNYVDNVNMCLGHTWYLSVDMQMYWVAPLLLIPLVRWPKYTLLAIALLACGSFALIFGLTYVHELSWTSPLNITNITLITNYWNMIYVNTPARAQPYLCGLALGYLLSRKDVIDKIRMPIWGVALGWILSIGTCLTVIYTLSINYKPGHEYNVLEASFYSSLHRLGWSLGICWIIFACATKRGGFMNSILSWRLLQPVSKICYCLYLIHPMQINMEGGTWRNHSYFSHFTTVHSFFGDLFFMIPTAALLYLMIEAPTNIILRSVFKKQKAVTFKNKDDKKNEEKKTNEDDKENEKDKENEEDKKNKD